MTLMIESACIIRNNVRSEPLLLGPKSAGIMLYLARNRTDNNSIALVKINDLYMYWTFCSFLAMMLILLLFGYKKAYNYLSKKAAI
ncbi:MAG: hypothetical protein GF335_02390 [Candidatus Moranbacteria bacterium]|nr:hypothetical protein [Candidatus Moranbacteria bacterium]